MLADVSRISPEFLLYGSDYERERARWRERTIDLKRRRRVQLGKNISLTFECWHTVVHQIQEVLYVESITCPRRLAEVIREYEVLLPNEEWVVATMMLYKGSGEAGDELGAAIDARRLRLRLGSSTTYGSPMTEDDCEGPVRYLKFPVRQAVKRSWLRKGGAASLELGLGGEMLKSELSYRWVEDFARDVSVFLPEKSRSHAGARDGRSARGGQLVSLPVHRGRVATMRGYGSPVT